ncbi:MAG: hypothetical protein KGI94_07290 [Paracoccaceae bacterium]|nr:hypothetical protein [Paracoccaceae bacterium]
MVSATEIYKSNLDAVSLGILTGDFRLIVQHIGVPILLSTGSREVVVSSVEEMEILISEYRQQLVSKGLVDYRRTCLWAEFQPNLPDMIVGAHRTEIVSADGFIVSPYQCRLVLMRIDGQWKAIWEQAHVAETDVEFLAPDIARAQQQAHAALNARLRTQQDRSEG